MIDAANWSVYGPWVGRMPRLSGRWVSPTAKGGGRFHRLGGQGPLVGGRGPEMLGVGVGRSPPSRPPETARRVRQGRPPPLLHPEPVHHVGWVMLAGRARDDLDDSEEIDARPGLSAVVQWLSPSRSARAPALVARAIRVRRTL
jgi:hypothetical protein